MAEFKNRRVVMRKRARRVQDLNLLKKKEAARFSMAVKRKYHISNFKVSRGYLAGNPAVVFTGNYKGYKIQISKSREIKEYHGFVQKRGNKGRTKHLTRETFFVGDSLKNSLIISTELVEQQKRGVNYGGI